MANASLLLTPMRNAVASLVCGDPSRARPTCPAPRPAQEKCFCVSMVCSSARRGLVRHHSPVPHHLPSAFGTLYGRAGLLQNLLAERANDIASAACLPG